MPVCSEGKGFPVSSVVKNLPSSIEADDRCRFNPWARKIPWRRKWQPTPVFLPGKFHGQRNLADYSPWCPKESDTTELLHFDFSLSCIGEGNGNPLQCSCLKNPRDGGAWWTAIYGIAQSRTQVKQLSSSSKSLNTACNSPIIRLIDLITQ